MKFLLVGFLIAAATASTVNHFWRGETMSPAKVAARWGKTEFDEGKFKNGSEDIRASMAYSLVSQKSKFVGIDALDIRKRLGNFDGFYFRDSFPTYLIYRAKNDQESSWQIVFLLDHDFKVANIIVHKNCCDRD